MRRKQIQRLRRVLLRLAEVQQLAAAHFRPVERQQHQPRERQHVHKRARQRLPRLPQVLKHLHMLRLHAFLVFHHHAHEVGQGAREGIGIVVRAAQEILHLLAQANQRLPGQQRIHLLLQFGRKRLHARAVHHVAQPSRALRASKERRVPFRRNDSVEHLRPELHQRQALAFRHRNHPMRIQPRQIIRQKAIDVFRGQYFLCVCTAFHFPIPLPQPDTISE